MRFLVLLLALLVLVACGSAADETGQTNPPSDVIENSDTHDDTLEPAEGLSELDGDEDTSAVEEVQTPPDTHEDDTKTEPADAVQDILQGDTGAEDTDTATSGNQCFAEKQGAITVDYDQFSPTFGSHCMGTNHQDIDGIEKVVFLGDSVTVGTPPYIGYSVHLFGALQEKYGLLELASCAEWGARTDDLLVGKKQIPKCFPGVEEKRTLVVMTVGSNDISSMAQNKLSEEEAMVESEKMLDLFRDAIRWFGDHPELFPKGVFIIFANIYEFTDGTGDVSSCPVAGLAGFDKSWSEGAQAFTHIMEQYMKLAVEESRDVILMQENFCGHGFKKDDPTTQCYLGPDVEMWFDPFTCTHPNNEGHKALSDMFMAVEGE
ncbi:MAG TPA: hypothetical protein EYN66_08930 [Myxococcales bacterium]|nr:hypothetical protein [Myxococcales bacterium]